MKIKLGIKDTFMAGYNFSTKSRFINEKDIMSHFNSIPVVHYNDVIWKDGYILGCLGTAGISTVIFVDDFFLQLPEYVKQFILGHEYSHIEYPAKKSGLKDVFKRNIKTSDIEVKCDIKSCKLTGIENGIKAMEYLAENTVGFTSKEFKRRLKEVKKYFEDNK
jgi:hypothetical protein